MQSIMLWKRMERRFYCVKNMSQLSDALMQKTVRRMVLADSACPLGTEQVVCREEAIWCQEKLITQNRQEAMASLPLVIFKNRADKYLPKVLGYTSSDWGDYSEPSLCPCSYFLPRVSRLRRKVAGIHKECTCFMVLPQPRSQNLA